MIVNKKLDIEQRLALTKFNIYKEPHIKIDKDKCRKCVGKPCILSCPAKLYTLDEKGELHFNYEGCLECGTCRVICPYNAVMWNHPKGGFGVWYKFG